SFDYVFHGGSGSEPEKIAEAVSHGVVKMNVDTDTQYAYTRGIAGHMFKSYDGVLKVDGGVGDKKAYDPRVWGARGEESKAGRIVCTGSCLQQWPPLIVKSRAAVPRRLAGVKGRFGIVKRPDGRLQVTYNGLAIYTYVDDGPNRVLCNNFNRWFVVRV